MLQLVYLSTPVARDDDALAEILAVSRRNNARDGITGILYSDGACFLQALEGPREATERCLGRIERDPRHRAIVVLSRQPIGKRSFGDWDMAHYEVGEDAGRFIARVARLVDDAPFDIASTFRHFAEMRAQSMRALEPRG